ncbi:MAG: hypothetical protein HY841_11055 [Bacteroidetes bacterium]|nr:hypothetical protein [Bacteroidota bacterium]
MVGKKSQHLSFISRQSRFENSVLLIQSWDDYNASGELASKDELVRFCADVNTKNNSVTTAKIPLDNARSERKALCFFNNKLNNAQCFEKLLTQIANYIASETGNKSVYYKRAHDMLKKLKPHFYKPKQKKNKRKIKHKHERSFNAVTGFADNTLALIEELIENGFYRNPSDAAISLDGIQNLSYNLHALNKKIILYDTRYKMAVVERKDCYKSMRERIRMIKKYLASFPEGKVSNHFIEFVRAVKG